MQLSFGQFYLYTITLTRLFYSIYRIHQGHMAHICRLLVKYCYHLTSTLWVYEDPFHWSKDRIRSIQVSNQITFHGYDLEHTVIKGHRL